MSDDVRIPLLSKIKEYQFPTASYNGDFVISIPPEYVIFKGPASSKIKDITIPFDRYQELLEAEKWKDAMTSAGIQSWEAYPLGEEILRKIDRG